MGERANMTDMVVEVDGDTFYLYTGANYDELAEVMEAHDRCACHGRSEHYPDLVLFATTAIGQLMGADIVYVRELVPGNWLRVTHDGYIEEYAGDPTG